MTLKHDKADDNLDFVCVVVAQLYRIRPGTCIFFVFAIHNKQLLRLFMSYTNPLLERLKRHLNVDIQQLVLNRTVLTNLQTYMSAYPTDSAMQCNFDAAFQYLDQCEGDPKCSLYAAMVDGKYYGLMMLRHGLKPDLRWRPSPEVAHQPFPGFRPQVDGFDARRVTDILILCSHGGPRGLGQLLVLWALALSQHGVFLQLSIRIETVETDFADPSSQLVGGKYLVTQHTYLEAAEHIYQKFGFRPVTVKNNRDEAVGGIFYYRGEPLTEYELTGYMSHLKSHGVVVDVPEMAESDLTMALPEELTSATVPFLEADMAAQPLSGSYPPNLWDPEPQAEPGVLAFDDEEHLFKGDHNDGFGPHFAQQSQPVYEIAGATNNDFPGAGPARVDNIPVPSNQPLLLVTPAPGFMHHHHGAFVSHQKRPRGRPRKPVALHPVKEPPAKKSGEFACPECGHKFTTKGNLKRHLQKGHTTSRRRGKYMSPPSDWDPSLIEANRDYQCSKCGKIFPGRFDNLQRHQSVHTAEKEAKRLSRKKNRQSN